MGWWRHNYSYGWGKFARLTQALEITLLAWPWMAAIAKAQDLSGAVSGTVSFLDAGLTTLGHIAAFVNCFQRGRLDVEMVSRDFLLCLTEEKLVEVSGSPTVSALSTTDEVDGTNAVLLTSTMSDSVMCSFMKHVAACYDVHSLVVSCLPLRKVALATEECVCNERCYCLCVWSTAGIMRKLALRLPGNIKQVSSELYLLPSFNCFNAGCHGCSHDMLKLILVALSSVLGIFGLVVFGTWIYGVIHAVVWMKWVVGFLLLGSDVITPISRDESGTLVYSSAFLLAAILAAVGGNWK